MTDFYYFSSHATRPVKPRHDTECFAKIRAIQQDLLDYNILNRTIDKNYP
ncbi:hypothetical protein [Rickettsia endosymbiont of Orchestes rusci]